MEYKIIDKNTVDQKHWENFYDIFEKNIFVAKLTIYYEKDDNNELLINSLEFEDSKYFMNFFDIIKIIIEYINNNFNTRNYIFEPNFIKIKIIENLSDIDWENEDNIISETYESLNLGSNMVNINNNTTYKYFNHNFNYNILSLGNDIYNFFEKNCLILKEEKRYLDEHKLKYYMFTKKCILSQNKKHSGIVEIKISSEEHKNSLYKNDTLDLIFTRQFYPIKIKYRSNDKDYYSNIIGIMFDKPITLYAHSVLDDLKFTLKINNKFYTKDKYNFNYRLNKFLHDPNFRSCTYVIGNSDTHCNGLYIYDFYGLSVCVTDEDHMKHIYSKESLIKQPSLYDQKYCYIELRKMIEDIHSDFPHQIYKHIFNYKYLPIPTNNFPISNITKQTDKLSISNDTKTEDKYDYIYIIHEREFINSKESIYKIGKTTNEIQKRYSNYPKNSRLLFTQHVNNCHRVEKDIIKELTKKTKVRIDIGREYFEGPLDYIIQIVSTICINNLPS